MVRGFAHSAARRKCFTVGRMPRGLP
jgi:hypothetical protein